MRGIHSRLAASCVAAAALAGCGGDDPEASAPCFSGADTYLSALETAPGEVRLEGVTPISDCLTDGQPGGDLGEVSQAVIEAATRLNAEARRDPSGEATVELGYLVGAIQEGASTTGGIHRDLVLRLDTAARFTRGGGAPPVEFERDFGKGYAAGQATG